MKVEDIRSDCQKSFESNEKDVCQSKGNDKNFDVPLRQKDPGDQKLEETPGNINPNTEVMYGQTAPNSSAADNAEIEAKTNTEEMPLLSNSVDADLSKEASMPTDKTKMKLSLSQNTSADVEMLSPESPACKSLLCNSSGDSHNPCIESQAPCAESLSSVESTNIDPSAGSGTVSDPDVTAMETDSSDMPVHGADSMKANEDSCGNQSQTRYTHTCSEVFSCL